MNIHYSSGLPSTPEWDLVRDEIGRIAAERAHDSAAEKEIVLLLSLLGADEADVHVLLVQAREEAERSSLSYGDHLVLMLEQVRGVVCAEVRLMAMRVGGG